MNAVAGIIPLVMLILIYMPLMALSIYCIVLFIKLAKRGIEAFDIYIEKNKQD